MIEERKDITLDEMAIRFAGERDMKIGRSALSTWPRPRGFTYKKTVHALEQERPGLLKPRREWFDAQLDLDPERLVFIDETGLGAKTARIRGRSLKGERWRTAIPHDHWKTMTFTGALRQTGMKAPMVLAGAVNGDAFRAYVEHVLAPTPSPADLVIMDNLPTRKASGVREAIEAALRHLPPYCPDFKPIENAFSQLKALLWTRAERTIDALWRAVADVIDLFHVVRELYLA